MSRITCPPYGVCLYCCCEKEKTKYLYPCGLVTVCICLLFFIVPVIAFLKLGNGFDILENQSATIKYNTTTVSSRHDGNFTGYALEVSSTFCCFPNATVIYTATLDGNTRTGVARIEDDMLWLIFDLHNQEHSKLELEYLVLHKAATCETMLIVTRPLQARDIIRIVPAMIQFISAIFAYLFISCCVSGLMVYSRFCAHRAPEQQPIISNKQGNNGSVVAVVFIEE